VLVGVKGVDSFFVSVGVDAGEDGVDAEEAFEVEAVECLRVGLFFPD